jgi:tetrahydromethanopterin S-methyltransferase subunit G
MKDEQTKMTITLESIDKKIDNLQGSINTLKKDQENKKGERNIGDIIWFLAVIGIIIYLLATGGFTAVFHWIKNIIIPG